jgi:selenocysteine lyase/cysteine desulfurase
MDTGSFGTFPRVVRDTMRSYQDECEARPDEFIRYKYSSLLDKSREALATLLKVPAETLVFVPNATTGINTVLRGLTYPPDDYILFFAPIYGACEKTVAYITETTPAKSIKIEYTYPVEDDWLVEEFKKTVQQVKSNGGRVKIALFDTITSNPGVRVPFERLTAACKEEGVLSCIDGAHSVGQLDINLGTLDPDFYVSNCHKYVSL